MLQVRPPRHQRPQREHKVPRETVCPQGRRTLQTVKPLRYEHIDTHCSPDETSPPRPSAPQTVNNILKITKTHNEIHKLFSKLKYGILFVSPRPSADPRTFTHDSVEGPIPQVEKPNYKETTHFLSDLEFKFSCAEIPVVCKKD